MNTNELFDAVVFDIDGTLFDTLPSLSAAANGVLVQAGLDPVETPLLRSALNDGLRPMFRKAIAHQATALTSALATELETQYFDQYIQQWLSLSPLYAHVPGVLSALKWRGVKLGICTNRDRASTLALLTQAGIAGVFDAVVGMGDAAQPKPAADPLRLALERLGIPAAKALFVGDSAVDATCAQLSQVRFAAHLGGYAGCAGDLLPNVFGFSDYEQFSHWVLAHSSATGESSHA